MFCKFAPAYLLLFISSALGATDATWHGSDGNVLAIGTLKSANGDTVQVLKPNNSTVELTVKALSVADRACVQARGKEDSEFQKAVRQWTSASGTHHIEAKAISFDDKSATLVRADNKTITVPLDKLSKDDRSYLERLKQAIAEKEANPFTEFGSVDSFTGNRPAAQPKLAAPQIPAADESTDNPTVYVTSSGTKYHAAGCRYLSKSSIPILLSEAIGKYSPCSACHPPGSAASSSSDSPAVKRSVRSSTPDKSSTDRNPNTESVTGHTATGIPTFTGPRGGQYHYSKSGNKVYERHKK